MARRLWRVFAAAAVAASLGAREGRRRAKKKSPRGCGGSDSLLEANCSSKASLLSLEGRPVDQSKYLYFDHVPKTAGSSMTLYGCAPVSSVVFRPMRNAAERTAVEDVHEVASSGQVIKGTWKRFRATLTVVYGGEASASTTTGAPGGLKRDVRVVVDANGTRCD